MAPNRISRPPTPSQPNNNSKRESTIVLGSESLQQVGEKTTNCTQIFALTKSRSKSRASQHIHAKTAYVGSLLCCQV
uniref:Uncharacterized protein n=1 Tax=Arundo donax TaxID=35708 RepID=A0A0A8XVN9_ARUDO